MSGKHGTLDTCKKEFEYAERTKGADKLVPVVIDPAVRNPRDWRGGVGMVLGSRACKDLSMDESDPAWEANMIALCAELLALKVAPMKGFPDRAAGVGTSRSLPCHSRGSEAI